MTLLCSLYTMAQTDAVWTFSGKVVDAKTRKAIAHASVTDRVVGTVTNDEGEFTLKLKAEPEAVTFSCLGYKSRRLSAAECKALEAAGKNPFTLDSKPEPDWSKFQDFLKGEVRYASLMKSFPENAAELFAKTEEFAKWRLGTYKRLAGV